MAIPFRLPTYHDPRAALAARASQLLADLMDTLGQLEQLGQPQQADSADWLIEEESDGQGGQPTVFAVNPQLLVDAIRAVHQYQPDDFDRVVGDVNDAVPAFSPFISCHANPSHTAPAAASPARSARAPRRRTTTESVPTMPVPTTCASQHARSPQSWHQVGNDLRRLAHQLSSDNKPKRVNCQSEVPATQQVSRHCPNFIQSLLASVLPKKLSYSAAVIYVGMRLLRLNLKDF